MEETLRTMNDLVSTGKVRYIGVSGAPAWKIAQSQMFAQFKGWAPFIGLQIEYSLLERTVEAELVPMAMEMGLGITTWSPLRGGLFSGKYNRSNNGVVNDSRRQVTGREAPLKEHELAINTDIVFSCATEKFYHSEIIIEHHALTRVLGRR